jgi:[FeFe] hydrogenase (group B1/B3)
MRGIYTSITQIRRQVFTEVARFAFGHHDYHELEEIPYKILPGEVPQYRESIFKERAIVGERLRLAMGLPLRKIDEHSALSVGVTEVAVPYRVLETPLVNVIPFACEACPTTAFCVTDNCRKCLAHPCVHVCPVKAITIGEDRAHIDREKCIRCGKCRDICPYSAIVKYDRPCAAACGVDAIESDYLGRAKINQDQCVACGMCIVSCPFGAIADKSEIFQFILALKSGKKIYAAMAPSFVGQFGPLATPEIVFQGIKNLGFSDVVEVGLGADVASIHEAKVFHEKVPGQQPYLGTSCCPSWAMMVEKRFPEQFAYISSSHTPMVATAQYIKERDPEAKVVFIGPCISKKIEALEAEVKNYIDFVITFEELIGMLVATGVNLIENGQAQSVEDASSCGRGYACSSGVAGAIVENIHQLYPDQQIQVDKADSLKGCIKMMSLAKAGQRNGYLLEGMACPGGCVGGPGTLLPTIKAEGKVKAFSLQSPFKTALDNPKANP